MEQKCEICGLPWADGHKCAVEFISSLPARSAKVQAVLEAARAWANWTINAYGEAYGRGLPSPITNLHKAVRALDDEDKKQND